MSSAKFAAITAILLARKGDERLSAWNAGDLVAKIAAAVHAAALRGESS